MNRRKFLKITALTTGGLMMFPSHLFSSTLMLGNNASNDDNILVFIQLNGGNDGLNTFIPYKDPLYYANRPFIGISKDKIINSVDGLGFHPALKDLASISQEGNLTIVQNVGYPKPNRSHFRSIEIWQTASDSDKYLNYGWLGRFLENQFADENLAAINVDMIDNLALKSREINGITIKDFKKTNGMFDEKSELKLSNNPQLDFVRKVQYASIEGMEEINKALKNAEKYSAEYANNPLSKNLEGIGKMIKGKMPSKIYYTSLSGFDTHNNQTEVHKRQLITLNDAVFSFYKDLKNNNLLNRVTLVIFSEFGRRVKENGQGTDHGTAGPMMIIGGNNSGKVIGKNPNLSNLDNGDLIFETDFRSVYATLLKEKFHFNAQQIGIKQETIKGIF